MFLHRNNLTIDRNRQLYREMLHEITSAYMRADRDRGY